MGAPDQPRDGHGRFVSGAVTEHVARRHAARTERLLSFGARTPQPEKHLSRAAQERQAILRGIDQRFGKRNVTH